MAIRMQHKDHERTNKMDIEDYGQTCTIGMSIVPWLLESVSLEHYLSEAAFRTLGQPPSHLAVIGLSHRN